MVQSRKSVRNVKRDIFHPSKWRDLNRRWVSALVLIPVALVSVYFGGFALAFACAVLAGIMGHEWATISGYKDRFFMVALCGLPCFVAGIVDFSLVSTPISLTNYQIGWAVFPVVVLLGLIRSQVGVRSYCESMAGVINAGGVSLLVFTLREGNWDGRAATLIFMSIVWAADATAFFVGKAFGGPKLLPIVSRNKTWIGLVGSIIVSLLLSGIAAHLMDGDNIAWLVACFFIAVLAQSGDLVESAIKRNFGVKDAGSILPGHGGMMDRVDGWGMVAFGTVITFVLFPESLKLLGLAL